MPPVYRVDNESAAPRRLFSGEGRIPLAVQQLAQRVPAEPESAVMPAAPARPPGLIAPDPLAGGIDAEHLDLMPAADPRAGGQRAFAGGFWRIEGGVPVDAENAGPQR